MSDIIERLEYSIANLTKNYYDLIRTISSNLGITVTNIITSKTEIDLPYQMTNKQLKIYQLRSNLEELKSIYEFLYSYYILLYKKECNYYFNDFKITKRKFEIRSSQFI